MNLPTSNRTGDADGHRAGAPFAILRRWRAGLLTKGLIMGLTSVLISGGDTLARPIELFGPKGGSVEEKRATIKQESTSMLEELFAQKPEMKKRLKDAAGYATFSKTEVKLLLVASGNGYGTLVDNATGKTTYMRVASLGGGVGMGVNDLRVIFVFNDKDVMRQFVEKGWQFGGSADATAKYDDVGATAGQTAKANVDFAEGTASGAASTDVRAGTGNDNAAGRQAGAGGAMEIYQFTERGISLQATVSGTKYWKDSELN